MNDLSSETIRNVELLYKQIENKQKIITMEWGMNYNNTRSTIEKIWVIKSLINRCIQCGNYKRAWRYMVVVNVLINRIEKEEKNFVNKITEMILEE